MGFLEGVGSKLKKAKKKYQDWDAKAPERREQRMTKLRAQEKKLLSKKEETDLRAKVQKMRQQSRPDFSKIQNVNPFGDPFTMAKQKQAKVKAKVLKKKSGSKPRKRVTEFF